MLLANFSVTCTAAKTDLCRIRQNREERMWPALAIGYALHLPAYVLGHFSCHRLVAVGVNYSTWHVLAYPHLQGFLIKQTLSKDNWSAILKIYMLFILYPSMWEGRHSTTLGAEIRQFSEQKQGSCHCSLRMACMEMTLQFDLGLVYQLVWCIW